MPALPDKENDNIYVMSAAESIKSSALQLRAQHLAVELLADKNNSLNKQLELVSKCRRTNRFLLKNDCVTG